VSQPSIDQEHKQRVRERFGSAAHEYVISPGHRGGRDMDRLVELAECTPDAEVLDVATGTGHTAFALAPHVRHVVASDLTPLMLDEARALGAEHGITNVTFEIAEAERLPVAGGSFDIVSCRIAPHHFTDCQAFVREVARVLRPGGRCVLIDSHSPEDDELDVFLNEVEQRRDPTHVRSYRLSEWTNWIEAAGLQIDIIEPFERRHEFASWTARGGMTDAGRAALERYMLDAPERVRDYFTVRVTEDGHVESFGDHKFLLRARN
jgi:ubiquinone/menaquinone biosynthesis C-methylase UbiE